MSYEEADLLALPCYLVIDKAQLRVHVFAIVAWFCSYKIAYALVPCVLRLF